MPRLRQSKDDVLVTKDLTLQGTIIKYSKIYGADAEYLAAMVGCSVGTIRNRLKNPQNITRVEEYRIVQALKIPKDEWDECRYV